MMASLKKYYRQRQRRLNKQCYRKVASKEEVTKAGMTVSLRRIVDSGRDV
jgi:hypothetical protein